MKSMFYEMRPWIFAAIGIGAMYGSKESTMSTIMVGSSALLLLSSFMILTARMKYRKEHRRF